MKIDNGGPAFPYGVRREIGDSYGGGEPYVMQDNEPGMSLRDWFAGQALAGPCTGMGGKCSDIARWAYRYADAMLTARQGGPDA